MAYSLSNKSAKNVCKRTVLVQLIIKNVVTFFLEHSVVLFTSKCVCPKPLLFFRFDHIVIQLS